MLMGAVTGGVPILAPAQRQRHRIVQALLTAIAVHAKAHRVIEGVIYWPDAWGMVDVLHELGYKYVRTIYGINVDVTRTADELWNSFSSTKRKNIRKARRYPIIIERGEKRDDVHEFHQLLIAAGNQKGFTPFPLGELLAIWSVYPKASLHLFFATLDQHRVAGVLVVQHAKSLFAIAAGSLREAWFCRPNDFLHWKVMEWACHQGYMRYNLGALNHPIPDPVIDGLWRWKRGFHPFLEKFHNFRATYTPGMKFLASLFRKSPFNHL
jgi:lipid II:glycine glycyltransferase (peptidoglycan interpeptide bridge formation enzyme)